MSSSINPLIPVETIAPAAPMERLTDETPRKPEPVAEPPSSATATPEQFATLVEERAAAEAHLATEPLMQLDVEARDGSVHAQKLVEKYALEQAAEDAERDQAGTTRADHDAITREVAARRADEDAAELQRIHQRTDNEAAEAAEAAARGIVADGANNYEAARSAASARAADEAAAQKRALDRATEDAAAEAAEAATKPHLDVKA